MNDSNACLLVREVAEVAKALREIYVAIKIEREDRRSIHDIERKLDDLHNQGVKIMSKLSDFLTAQEQFNATQSAGIDSVVESVSSVSTSLTGLAGDVQSLNDKITELQNSVGGVTPEDQARIDNLQSQGATMAEKVTSASAALATAATALAALDAATPPVVPPPAALK